MRALLRVPRSSVYAWRQHVVSTQTLCREHIKVLVIDVFHGFREVSGCQQITEELNKRGGACSFGFIATVMKELGLVTVQPRAHRGTTVRDDGDIYRSDSIERDLTSDTPGTRLIGDVTYLRTGQGWVFLAKITDLSTRMVVGWCMGDNMRSPMIERALEMARLHSHLKPGAVFHSGRGPQCASRDFAKYSKNIKITRGIGKHGCVLG
jgi:putative transposase